MTTDELRDLLLQGGNHCSVYLGENFEDAKPVTEQLLALGFPHGQSGYSHKVCYTYDESKYGEFAPFHWHYANITANVGHGIEYNNYKNIETILTLDDLLNPAPSAPDPTPEEIEAFYLEAIGVLS